MIGTYDDIIALPHYTPKTRPRMSRHERAAQFAAFAALTGYEEAIAKTVRSTQERQAAAENYLRHVQEDR